MVWCKPDRFSLVQRVRAGARRRQREGQHDGEVPRGPSAGEGRADDHRRGDRDRPHLPSRVRPAAVRGVPPGRRRLGPRGAAALLRGVRGDRPREPRRPRPGEPDLAGEPGLGAPARVHARGARRHEPRGHRADGGHPPAARQRDQPHRRQRVRRSARRRVRRRRHHERRGGRGVPRPPDRRLRGIGRGHDHRDHHGLRGRRPSASPGPPSPPGSRRRSRSPSRPTGGSRAGSPSARRSRRSTTPPAGPRRTS